MRMKKNWILAVWFSMAAPLFGQSPPPPAFPGVDPLLGGPEVVESAQPTVIVHAPLRPVTTGPIRFWARADFLGWWLKDAPLPISLVTTGDPQANPGAELLDSSRRFGPFAGMRIALGGWFDDNNNIGVEANYFFLGQRRSTFFVASDHAGNPTLALPFFDQTPGNVGGNALFISSPRQFAGDLLVSSCIELLGTEINGAFCLLRTPHTEFTVLGGFRYLQLQENLNISNVTSDLMVFPHAITNIDDNFNTRNQFYGGQLAGRFVLQNNLCSLDVTGKLAMGSTHEIADVQGYTTQFGPGTANGSFRGGFFAQPSNIGRSTRDQFTVLPALEAKLNLHLLPRLRLFVGYDFLYWSQVLRPGNQIDRNINLSQSAVLGNGALIGPAAPAPLLQRSDFWAQGVNVGLELRF